MQLTVQQPNLEQMFGQGNLYNTLYGMHQQDQANANNAQNLGQAQQEQTFQAQDQPYKLQQLAADVGHTNALTGLAQAQTPGATAESTLKKNAADVDSSLPFDKKRDAALTKLASDMTAEKLKQHMDQAAQDLTATLPDGTPDVVKRRNAQLVISTAPDLQKKMMELKQEGDNSARVAGITSGAMLKAQQMQIEAGKYDNHKLSFMMSQAMAKANFQQQASIAQMQADQALSAAAQAQDPEEKQYYQAQAQNYLNQKQEAVLNDYRAKQAAGTAANVAKPDLNGLGVPTVLPQSALPAPPVAPGLTPVADPTKSDMVQMKDKNGVPHLVPKANVQRALAGGWSQ